MFLLRHLEDAHPWLDKFHVRVLPLDEADDLRRIDRSQVHVRLEADTGHLRYVVEGLAVLSATEGEPETVLRIEPQSHLLGFSKEVDAVINLIL